MLKKARPLLNIMKWYEKDSTNSSRLNKFDVGKMTSKKISKGSRIVAVLNIIKEPFTEINYGTGKEVSEETIADAKEPLEVKWFNDSFIEIPIWKE